MLQTVAVRAEDTDFFFTITAVEQKNQSREKKKKEKKSGGLDKKESPHLMLPIW